ncbi:Protein sat1 [Schizosaccharomyces pombe]
MTECDVQMYMPVNVVQSGTDFECIVKFTNPRSSEDVNLLLCYASIHGEMYLDYVLVRVTEFDEVQRQGLLNKRTMSGLVHIPKVSSSYSVINTLNGMIGNLFGVKQASTLTEASEQKQENAIPVLLTRPDILGVDITLSPGEEKCFRLKRRIPLRTAPTYKGLAFRFQHALVIGVQSATNNACVEHEFEITIVPNVQQQPELPLGKNSGNRQSSKLFADLSKPIIETDAAEIEEVSAEKARRQFGKNGIRLSQDAQEEEKQKKKYEQHIKKLLDGESNEEGGGEFQDHGMRSEINEEVLEEEDEEKVALLKKLESKQPMATRFEITSKQKVLCRLLLSKSRYRTGEMMMIELEGLDAMVRQVHMQLESVERIVPDIRIRNSVGTERATRKVWCRITRGVFELENMSASMVVPEECPETFETQQFGVEHFLRVELLRAVNKKREMQGPAHPRYSEEVQSPSRSRYSEEVQRASEGRLSEEVSKEEEKKGGRESGQHKRMASLTNSREMQIQHAPTTFAAETIQCVLPIRIEKRVVWMEDGMEGGMEGMQPV